MALAYAEHQPRPELRPFVECLWVVSSPRPLTKRNPERVVPDGCPELIVHLGDRFERRVGRRWLKQPRVFLAGTLTRPWLLRPGRHVRTLGIRFRAGATTAVLPVDMAAAVDSEVPLGKLVTAAEVSRLVEALRVANGASGRFRVLEEWLMSRVERRNDARASAHSALDVLRLSKGRATVEEVAQAIGWSRRRLERAFKLHLGIRPKLYARIVRLNAVLAKLSAGERETAVDIALDAGYFDQAHLLRDFRVLAGRTPRAGRESDGAMARHFTRPERLKVLLEGE